MGRCASCGEWNTIVEEVVQKDEPEKGGWRSPSAGPGSLKVAAKPKALHAINYEEQPRIYTVDGELNRVLGGGIVAGSLVLIGGEPGIGKSTLLLQIALSLAGMRVLYVSGEESEQQIKMRAERLDAPTSDCHVMTETSTQNIFRVVEHFEPEILIIDSIQTMQSSLVESGAGSVSQVRECAAEFMKYAKESGVPVFMIGHITKEGTLAGPKVLEHMVDTVLTFEGDRHTTYRILRTNKNRFGSTDELGIYEMLGSGLRQVTNPSEILISQRDEALSGVTIGSMLEGNRPLLIESQALGKRGYLWYAPTKQHRFRCQATEYVACRIGETRRLPAWSAGCIPEHCRWFACRRSGHRLSRLCRHCVELRRHCHSAIHRFCCRGWAWGRGAGSKPDRIPHCRSRKTGFQTNVYLQV